MYRDSRFFGINVQVGVGRRLAADRWVDVEAVDGRVFRGCGRFRRARAVNGYEGSRQIALAGVVRLPGKAEPCRIRRRGRLRHCRRRNRRGGGAPAGNRDRDNQRQRDCDKNSPHLTKAGLRRRPYDGLHCFVQALRLPSAHAMLMPCSLRLTHACVKLLDFSALAALCRSSDRCRCSNRGFSIPRHTRRTLLWKKGLRFLER